MGQSADPSDFKRLGADLKLQGRVVSVLVPD